MVCCNCKGKAWYGDPLGKVGTFFECGCQCHKNKGIYPKAKQARWEKKHPDTNPKSKDFPKWFENDKREKQAKAKEIRTQKE